MKKNEKIAATVKAITTIANMIADYNQRNFGYTYWSEYFSDYDRYEYCGYDPTELGPGPENFMVRLLDHNQKFLVQNWTCNSEQGCLENLFDGPLPKAIKGIDSPISHFVWDNAEYLLKARYLVVLDLYAEHKVAGHRARHEKGKLFQIMSNGQVRYVGPWQERVFLLGDPYFKKDGWSCARDEAARAALDAGTYNGRRPRRCNEPANRRRRGGTATAV